jgi:UDPglucose--hexose-1-phosphate uridylyltransferase
MSDDRALVGAHRRHDPLRDAWVLVSPSRSSRPWLGQTEALPREAAPAYDPGCPLCPGNLRASGVRNPEYEGTFVFDNDFPALQAGTRVARTQVGIHIAESEAGAARVVCYSPRHDRSLGSLAQPATRAVVDAWTEQTAELMATYPWVQVFENRGPAMGASNPHPHGQIWAGTAVPTEAAREDRTQADHLARTGRVLLDEVAAQELDGPRLIEQAGAWLAIVPYWATWPFETLVIGPSPAARLPDLDGPQRDDLAALLGRLLRRYDALFDRPFPYSMGWHQAPAAAGGAAEDVGHWRLHAHLYPPLLRADARKFMVGYELLSEPQRDLTPEDAAARLRAAIGP